MPILASQPSLPFPRSGPGYVGWACLMAVASSAGTLLAQAPSAPVDAASTDRPLVIVVVGAPGTPEYGREFTAWAARWEAAAQAGRAACLVLGLPGREAPPAPSPEPLRDRLQRVLADASRTPPAAVWLVLIGHGTFDGETPRFNLEGPDVAAAELAAWLQPLVVPVAVVNCASASGPFLPILSGTDRLVITATKSGHEIQFARFGDYLSRAVADPQADLDRDGQTSLLEAYLAASRQVADFYRERGRLATEHALLDDNADRQGTPADWFQGIRPTRRPQGTAAVDGVRAHQWHLVPSPAERDQPRAWRQRRDRLELAVIALRDRQAEFPTRDAYFVELKPLLVQLAELYAELEQ